jgi:hypothetical protein
LSYPTPGSTFGGELRGRIFKTLIFKNIENFVIDNGVKPPKAASAINLKYNISLVLGVSCGCA